MIKNSENNGTEAIGLVTPIPGHIHRYPEKPHKHVCNIIDNSTVPADGPVSLFYHRYSFSQSRRHMRYLLSSDKRTRMGNYRHITVTSWARWGFKSQASRLFAKRLFSRRSKKTSKLLVASLCQGNPPVIGGSPHKGSVTRKMFPFDDVTMNQNRKNMPNFADNVALYWFYWPSIVLSKDIWRHNDGRFWVTYVNLISN